ncbi:SHOCT domain-containing protein [Haloplanus ruber]|uniref:SHOCT domain-containing protein n=1 Tax=Haloplanus ruber TaxID=869892 RepID=A0ABD6D1G0_9EURY|nr:SHOCT domain-containing protein [Haloplanus ruber]
MQLPTHALGGLAQHHPGPHGPGPHWGGGHHWGAGSLGDAGMGAFGPWGGWWLLLVLLAVLAVVAVGYLAARRIEGDADEALATLRERYAAGELDDEEFERRRNRLTERIG